MLKQVFHILEENFKTGQTNAQSALHSMPDSCVTKHLRIGLAVKEALDTIMWPKTKLDVIADNKISNCRHSR